MTVVRQPAFAGRFYPDDPAELRRTIGGLLDQAEQRFTSLTREAGASGDQPPSPKAIIGPHAGYVYSGPIAASAYYPLRTFRDQFERVILIGPAHRVAVAGLAASSARAFATPLGSVEVDVETLSQLLRLPQVQVFDAAHQREHSLEVHLPFLQETLGRFRIVPLVVGQSNPEQVAAVIETVWDRPGTLFVISSDLSHYHDYETARRLDRETARTIEQGQADRLRPDRACGFLGIAGLLLAAARDRLKASTLDLRNSGDTAGSRDRVVGYGAFMVASRQADQIPASRDAPGVALQPERPGAISSADTREHEQVHERRGGPTQKGQAAETGRIPASPAPPVFTSFSLRLPSSPAPPSVPDPCPLTPDHESTLLDVARAAIEYGLSAGKKPQIDAGAYPDPLSLPRATFVTLQKRGELRGCMGSLKATQPLVCDVAGNAYSAAFLDPRFQPLTAAESDDLKIHISILSRPEPIHFESEDDLVAQLRRGVDGLIVYEGSRRGTLLPAVWEKIPDPRQFLAAVKQKAGLPCDYWSSTLRVERYTTASIPRSR